MTLFKHTKPGNTDVLNTTKTIQTSPAFHFHLIQTSRQVQFQSSAVQTGPVPVSRFFKQLEVESDHDLSRGNLVEKQPLCNWSFRALVLLDFCQADLRPAQEVCGQKWNTYSKSEVKEADGGSLKSILDLLLLTIRGELVSFKHSDTEDILLQVLYKKLTVGVPLGI